MNSRLSVPRSEKVRLFALWLVQAQHALIPELLLEAQLDYRFIYNYRGTAGAKIAGRGYHHPRCNLGGVNPFGIMLLGGSLAAGALVRRGHPA